MSGYSITYNGFTLSNTDTTSVQFFDGWSNVPMRVASDVRTGQHGGQIWDRKFDMRPLTLKGVFHTNDYTTYYSLLSQFIKAFFVDASGIMAITRLDGTVKAINAKVIDIPRFIESTGETMMCAFEVMLKSEQVFYTDLTPVTTLPIYPATTGGTPVSTPVPMPVGGATNVLAVINNGDQSVWPIFQITGTIQTPAVTNLTTGQSFTIATTVPAGNTMLAYTDNTGPYVTLNGASYFSYLQTSMFQLMPGSNLISFNGASFDSNANLILVYSQLYNF